MGERPSIRTVKPGMRQRNGKLRIIHGREGGFTLIEIMVVVVILGILAALVAPNVISRIDDAQINRARQDVRAVESAMHLYRLDNFKYPTTDQGVDSLVTRPADPSIRSWRKGGYLDKTPKDPWGVPYQYLYPGQNSEFDVFTLGADGQPGGEGINADIGNWSID
jgi:general secretion pathway protein G